MTLAASKERLESYASAGPLFSALPSIDAQDANCPEMSELARRKTPVVVRCPRSFNDKSFSRPWLGLATNAS